MFEVKLKAPLNVEWEITNLCNLRCLHCYVGAGKKLLNELTTKEALDLIAELDRIGVSDITISGGEPFLRKDIMHIIKEIRKREIPLIIYTNGTLIDRQVIQELAGLGIDSISISLDGAKPETHNFVENARTFERVLKTIQMLKDQKFRVQVLYTLMKVNMNELDDLFALAKQLCIDAVCLYPFYSAGRGSQNLGYLELDAKVVKNILKNVMLKKDKGPVPVYVGGCSSTHFSPTERHLLIGGAPCAKLTAIITADGHLRPCNFLPFRTKYGIREKRITDLWKDPLLEKIRDWNRRLKMDCSNCEQLPLCFGSCLIMHMKKTKADFSLDMRNLSE